VIDPFLAEPLYETCHERRAASRRREHLEKKMPI
jgi:hypothetical protein